MKAVRLLLFLFIIAVPIAYARIWVTDSVNIKISEILLLVIILVFHKRLKLLNRNLLKYRILLLLFMFGYLLSLLSSQDIEMSMNRSAVVVFPLIMVFTLPEVLTLIDSILLRYLKISLAISIIFGVISLLFYTYSVDHRLVFPSVYGVRIGSFLGDPNRFGSFLNIYTCLLVYEYFSKREKKQLVMLIIAIAFVFMTGSRASIIIGMSYIVVVLFGRKQRVLGKRDIFVQIIVIITILIVAYPDISRRIERIGKSHSSYTYDVRQEINRQGLREFIKNPLLGSGPFTFDQDKYIILHGRYQRATSHNMYLEILSTMGLIGFIPYILFLLTMLKELYVIRKNTADYVYSWLFLSLLGFMVHGLVIETFTERYVWLYFSVILYYIQKHKRQSETKFQYNE